MVVQSYKSLECSSLLNSSASVFTFDWVWRVPVCYCNYPPPSFSRPWSARTNLLQLSLSTVIIIASWTSLPHHIRMSSIHLRTGCPGRLSPSTIPNINDVVAAVGCRTFCRYGRTAEAFSVWWCPSPSTPAALVFWLHCWRCGRASWFPACI